MTQESDKHLAQWFDILRNGTLDDIIDAVLPTPTAEILELCTEWKDVGSRVTCNPAPTDTDRDILCLVPDKAAFSEHCLAEEFTSETKHYKDQQDPSRFTSLRRNSVNLIVTDDREFFDLFMLATAVSKARNILEKPERVKLFQVILYGKYPE